VIVGFTDDWWELSEDLVDLVVAASGVELTPAARSDLVEVLVDLLTLLTCWPTSVRPDEPLVYLRTRRARMACHAPWLYALPVSTRKLLLGTGSLPSILEFALVEREADRDLLLAWRNALSAVVRSNGHLSHRRPAEGSTGPTAGGSRHRGPF
jgi:hypothetical protein